MSTVRSESDIIRQSMTHALKQLDYLFVVDCGSDDNTVEILKDLQKEYPNLILIGRLGPHYAEQLRWQIWNRFAPQFPESAWWAIIDADEFSIDPYSEIIAQAENEGADHVFARMIDFYIVDSERDDWNAGRETLEDRARPIGERRRFFNPRHNFQIRFFKNKRYLRWNIDSSFPHNIVQPLSDCPIFRHYKYRDLPQLEYRVKSRNHWAKDDPVMVDNPHWNKQSVEECISRNDEEGMLYWEPDTPFPLDRKDRPLPYPVTPGRLWLRRIRSWLAPLTAQRCTELFEDFKNWSPRRK